MNFRNNVIFSNSKSKSQMDKIKIFFHEQGKFNFFMEQDTMANIIKLEPSLLHWQSATTFSITKRKFKALNRDDKECEDKSDYIWNDCLDEMFEHVLGYKDPWNINPRVPLPTATNMTIIQRGFRRGPLFNTVDFDQQFLDRPFMAEKELAGLTQDRKRICMDLVHG